MNRSELDSKHLAELHTMAAEAGIERFRMLPREELIEALAGGGGGASKPAPRGESRGGRGSQGGRSRESGGGGGRGGRERRPRDREREPRKKDPSQGRPAEAEKSEPAESRPATPPPAGDSGERPRRRRRRRFGRRGRKSIRVQDVLLPAAPGQQVLVYAESRAGCTALLRELAAELAGGRGPDPVALLVDPSPEELADWKREAPKAEIVSAGQERHAEDALAQAARRAESGEAVVLLVDSLSRAAEEFGGAKTAKELFDAGRAAGAPGSGSLTIVAAIERPE
jgi:transcription termination factor Rho